MPEELAVLRRRLLSDPATATPGMLYCLLDAASGPDVFASLQGFAAEEYLAPLYAGDTAAELAAAAPYLAAPEPDGRLLRWLCEAAWDTGWGLFFWSEADAETLRLHFRRLARVRTEDGRVLLFRLYDPRVLSAFLPTCDFGQLTEVFGPVARFGVTIEAEPALHLFDTEDGVLQQARVAA